MRVHDGTGGGQNHFKKLQRAMILPHCVKACLCQKLQTYRRKWKMEPKSGLSQISHSSPHLPMVSTMLTYKKLLWAGCELLCYNVTEQLGIQTSAQI